MKKLILLSFLLVAPFAVAETPLTIAISPQGAAIQAGSTIQLSAACTYAVHGADDCTAAGGVVWSTSQTSNSVIMVSSSGLVTAVSGPASGVIPGYFIVAAAGGLKDKIQVDIQNTSDTWYQYPTPDYHNYADTMTNAFLPLNVVVGSTVTVGSGVIANLTTSTTGTPFNAVCNWVSSDNTLATVNRLGLVTAIAPGTVTITCNVPGNWVSGTSTITGWQTPGNYVTLTIVPGGSSSNTWYVRPDGGTPWYDGTSTPYGQCTGTTDAAYLGATTNIWMSNHTYNIGDMIAGPTGYVYTVSVAGVSGAAHPTWTGTTITDNTVTWTQGSLYLVDQACALGNLRYLWTDLATYEQIFWNPAFHGGDTVIVRQNTNGYAMGPDGAPQFGGPSNCYGAGSGCIMPTIPSGTAAHHTRILGENYASCTSDSAKTLLLGTWNGYTLLNTKDSQFVDIACLELTDHADCGGSSHFVNACANVPGSSASSYGIMQSALTSDVTYTDLYIHGLEEEGIHGATGLGVVANRVHIQGMPNAGINMDDDPWTIGNISVAGGFTMNNSITEFTGCVEEYPIAHQYPYIECRDQTAGAYGDGFGTASAVGDWSFDHDIWRYNYQDGLDLLHSGLHSLSVTSSYSYGNDGQQWKIGSGTQVAFQTNLTVHNCNRLSAVIGDEPPTAIVPAANNTVTHSTSSLVITYTNGVVAATVGALTTTPTTGGSVTLAANSTTYLWIDPTSFTLQSSTSGFASGLGQQFELGIATTNGTGVNGYSTYNMQVTFCRASGDGLAIAFDGLGTDIFQNNTFVGYGSTSYDIECTGGWQTCAAANTVFENNVNLGIENVNYDASQLPGLFYFQQDSGWSTIDHNLYYNFRNGCPTLHTGEICSDPMLVNEPPLTISSESTLDNFNFNITSGSPAVHSGVYLPAITTDNAGNPFANPPSMGALEFLGSPPPPTNFSGGILNGTIQ